MRTLQARRLRRAALLGRLFGQGERSCNRRAKRTIESLPPQELRRPVRLTRMPHDLQMVEIKPNIRNRAVVFLSRGGHDSKLSRQSCLPIRNVSPFGDAPPTSFIALWALLLCSLLREGFLHAAPSAASQRLSDYTRVVIAEDALPVQRAAAEELAGYAGRTVKLTLPRRASWRDTSGLSFFIGGAAEKALGPKAFAMEARGMAFAYGPPRSCSCGRRPTR